jgi:hypothetical protein
VTRVSDLLHVDFLELIEVTREYRSNHPDTVLVEQPGYIVTDRLKEEYDRLFCAMASVLESPDERVGIWISGPPGSGKSCFAKNVGNVLAHRDGYAVSGRTQGVELFHRSAPYRIFPVNLRPETAAETHAEYIVEAMYRTLLRELDYSEDYDIAELEMALEKQGRLAPFRALCRTQYQKNWRDLRKTGDRFACASSLVHRLAPETYASTDAWWKAVQARPCERPSAKHLVEKAFELCELRCPGKTFAFVVDEIGPYARLGSERIENLRAVIEQSGKQSLQRLKAGKIPGPAWIVVIAQEKLAEMSRHLAASRINLSKLEEHFRHQVELSLGDIREVVARRALGKKAGQESIIRKLFRDRGDALIQNVQLEGCCRRTHFDEDEFVRFYPYLPHMIDLSMEIIAGIGLDAARAGQFPKSHPTLIGHCLEMFLPHRTRLAQQPAGALVSIDLIYDLLEENLPQEKRKQTRQVRQRFDNDEEHAGMAGKVAKAICLMELVKTDLPRTTKNIAALLIQNVSEEPPAPAVAKILDQLKQARYVLETEQGWQFYDFDELRRRTAILKELRKAVGGVNPRLPGWRNDLIQVAKKLLARFLSWYTGPLYAFDAAVSRSLEEVVLAVDHLTTSLAALEPGSITQAFDYLPVNMTGLEEQLAQLEEARAPVAKSVEAHVALLHRQVKVLADMQRNVNLEAGPPGGQIEASRSIGNGQESRISIDPSRGKVPQGMRRPSDQSQDRTIYIIGLFGTGRWYVNKLLLENLGERAKYFRDAIRLHPGPTPMIYSGHVTVKYPSLAQESPVVMKGILAAVQSGFADSIFIYRHPLDSLLTNWVWWRTYMRDNRAISGISEVYKNVQDLCADLEKHFREFEMFAEGDPGFFAAGFFAAKPGPRFLSFSEFVEETELHLQYNRLALRLEDFAADPLREFAKICGVIPAGIDLSRVFLAPPRTKPYGHLAVREQVPRFRKFMEGLDAETKKRIEKIGYTVSW